MSGRRIVLAARRADSLQPDGLRGLWPVLRRLSGRTHEVLSAVCVVDQDSEHVALSTSRVTFSRLTETEIAQYWETGEPVDKAGAYAIQGKAAAFIERLEGSYSGVMGLPLQELAEILKKIGRGGA